MTRSSRLSAFLSGSGSIAVSMAVMNVATYGFTIIAARMLGPKSYGALASLMATLLVVTVLQLGLQATAARRIAAEPGHVAQIERTILGVTYRAAVGLGALLLVLAPLLNVVLRLESLPTAALLALVSIPFTIMGGQAGILQGERRWGALSVLYLLSGVPRLIIGTALIAWQPSELTALAATGIGACFPVIAGWRYLRRPRAAGVHTEEHGFRQVMQETFHNSQVLLAFFALSNVDIVLARNVLDEHDAGLYAGGLILTKAVLFLPQFIVVIAFPSMATQTGRRRALTASLSLIALLGAMVTIGAAVVPDLALIFVGGSDYDEIAAHLWIFAILGTFLAMLQLLVYSVLARQGQRSVYLVWIALATIIGVGLTTSTLRGLLTVVITTDAILLAALLCISLVVIRRPAAPTPEPVPAQ
ncbi:lipopolysaccharide biosynthesis protein [Nocardioides sp. URHA0020]|uniref:lipopolysaccharide biosynthesis protein n=1 Tax=Nocardioides sp. URHA0020 TaxID=1380392 RepID=UPI000A541D3C|nr:oligosaccharide flippase family protein [Nocardioides sp. URHA0020]